jgi:hypothetical protein
MSQDSAAIERRQQVLPAALVALAAVVGLAALVFVVRAVTGRPDNPVEAELIFEAARLAHGWPLYVDPAIGASELGNPPSRFLVLYTPVWPFVVGHLGQLGGASQQVLRLTGRTLATIGWLVVFACPVLGAPARTRRATLVAALLGAGIYFLARNAPTVTPDTVATALVCVAFVRIARQQRVGALAAALLVIAPFFKPSCIGAAAGLAVALLWPVRAAWTPRLRPILAAAITGALLVLFCHVMSDGQWLVHLSRSTKQPLDWERFSQEMSGRIVVLGLPQVIVAVVGLRRGASRFLTWPLLASCAWAAFAMAKHGSGSHYWLEPTALSVVLVAFMPPRVIGEETLLSAKNEVHLLRGVTLLAILLVGVTSLPGYGREMRNWKNRAASFAELDAHCTRAPGEIVASPDVALEMALNDRITVPDWQSSFLARRGVFPLEGWRSDLRDPHVRWLALPFDPDQPAPDTNDERIEVSAYRDVLRDVVRENFTRDAWVGGFLVFSRRSSPR